MALHDYDIYLRHAAIRDGDWVGFRLAWEGLGGLDGVTQPHLRQRLWGHVTDPSQPDSGAWGSWVWTLYLTLHKGLVGLQGRHPADGYSDPSDMLGWVRAFGDMAAMELQDVDGAIFIVKFYGYQERCIEAYDAAHDGDGGWLVRLDLVETSL
jgi:hypothetical protein